LIIGSSSLDRKFDTCRAQDLSDPCIISPLSPEFGEGSLMHRRRTYQILCAAIFSATPVAFAANGTFLDRELPADVRVMDWNVNNDSIFADVNATRNAKFNRIAAAVNADIYTFEEMYNHTATDVLNLVN